MLWAASPPPIAIKMNAVKAKNPVLISARGAEPLSLGRSNNKVQTVAIRLVGFFQPVSKFAVA
jgi:hypothetical protein